MLNSTPTDGAPTEAPQPVQITLELLETRLAAMAQQQERLIGEAAQVHGAMQFCANLIALMRGETPQEKPMTDLPTGEELKRLRAEATAADTAAREAQAEALKHPAKKPAAKPKPK